jgi:hypothetical protein
VQVRFHARATISFRSGCSGYDSLASNRRRSLSCTGTISSLPLAFSPSLPPSHSLYVLPNCHPIYCGYRAYLSGIIILVHTRY